MPNTPLYGLPYPAPSDTPDVPYWQQQLAEDVEDVLAAPMVKIAQGAAQTYGTTTSPVVLDFAGGVVSYDTLGTMADIANDQIVIRKAGYYRLTACVNWSSNATGYRATLIRKNGSTYIAQDYRGAVNGTVTLTTLTTEPLLLAVSDTIQVLQVQNSTASLASSAANGMYPYLAAHWVRA